MIVFKLIFFNSSLFLIDSALDGYVKVLSFPYLLSIYLFTLIDVVIIGFFFAKPKKTKPYFVKHYCKNRRGYTCLDHHLYDMDYIQATSHFGLYHGITLDEVKDE